MKNAKLEAEAKAAREAEIQKELDRVAAAELAAKAPRKEKLSKWVNNLSLELPPSELLNDTLALDVLAKFNGFKTWATNEINKI